MNRRIIGSVGIGGAIALLLCLLAVPMMVFGGSTLLFAGGGGCVPGSNGTAAQPGVSAQAANSIPASYLMWYRKVGAQYGVPWTILAGIGKVESDHGRSTLQGVTSGANAFGAAGPMQIGIGGAAGNQWATLATSEDGKLPPSVYDPADAIAGAAKYLIAHGVQSNVPAAIFAYNHLDSYVQDVLGWASTYASGGYTVAVASGSGSGSAASGPGSCAGTGMLDSVTTPNAAVAMAVNFAQAQLGKPYLFGGTGPDAFDCSGLVMMAYRAAGINIPRTSQEQWAQLPHVPAANVEAGDLVFFAGADGTRAAPGHVGLVIGHDTMIEAYATGVPVRISTFGTPASPPGLAQVVGFARPWAQPGLNLANGSGG